MTKLRKSKVKMSGPSGEIMQSTHTGTIVFPCGDNTIHFCDALIVPTLERNLLSLSKILDSNPDLFVVFNKDRLCRFGVEILEYILSLHESKLVVHEPNDILESRSEELTDDLMAITRVFSCSYYGSKRFKGKEDKILPDEKTDTNIEEVVQVSSIHL